MVFSRRTEVATILRGDGRDERRAAINPRASALTLQVVVVAFTVLFVELAEGHDPGTWGTICARCTCPHRQVPAQFLQQCLQ